MDINTGKMYLIVERAPVSTHRALRKEMTRGKKVLYISKVPPHVLRNQFDFDEESLQIRWLNIRPNDDCIPPMNLEKMGSEIEQFLAENHNGIICLNGMEVLEMWNGLASVVNMLRKAQQSVRITDNTIVVSLDPKKLFWNDISSLKRISDDVVMCTG
jgi:hypothetical protein